MQDSGTRTQIPRPPVLQEGNLEEYLATVNTYIAQHLKQEGPRRETAHDQHEYLPHEQTEQKEKQPIPTGHRLEFRKHGSTQGELQNEHSHDPTTIAPLLSEQHVKTSAFPVGLLEQAKTFHEGDSLPRAKEVPRLPDQQAIAAIEAMMHKIGQYVESAPMGRPASPTTVAYRGALTRLQRLKRLHDQAVAADNDLVAQTMIVCMEAHNLQNKATALSHQCRKRVDVKRNQEVPSFTLAGAAAAILFEGIEL
jgi:hypothetical protein